MRLFFLDHRLRVTLLTILFLLSVVAASMIYDGRIPLRGDIVSPAVPSLSLRMGWEAAPPVIREDPTFVPHVFLSWEVQTADVHPTVSIKRKIFKINQTIPVGSGTASWQYLQPVYGESRYTDRDLQPNTRYDYQICINPENVICSPIQEISLPMPQLPTPNLAWTLHPDSDQQGSDTIVQLQVKHPGGTPYLLFPFNFYDNVKKTFWRREVTENTDLNTSWERSADVVLLQNPNTTYEFYVQISGTYLGSVSSNVVRVTTPNRPPAQPDSCSALPLDASRIRLSARTVRPASDGRNGDPSVHRLYRADPSTNGTYQYIALLDANNRWEDTERRAGVRYEYRVTAINGAGESPPCSVAVTIPTQAPSAPVDLLLETDAAKKNATLRWTFAPEEASTAPMFFSVWRALQPTGPYAHIASVLSSERFFTVPLLDGVTNFFSVKADNYLSASPASNVVSIAVPPAGPVLSPVARTDFLSPTAIHISWRTYNTDTRRMRVQRFSPDTNAFETIYTTASAAETSFVDTELQPNTDYRYKVISFDATGQSWESPAMSVRTQPLLVYPPSFVRAHPISGDRFRLEWWDINTSEERYDVEYSIAEMDNGRFFPLGSVGKDLALFTTPSLMPGYTYAFRVRAYNSLGFSDYSNTATAFLPDEAPPAPSALIGQFAGHANLQWMMEDASQTALLIIEQSTDAIEGFSEVAVVPFDPQCRFSTLGNNETDCGTWNSRTLLPGEEYFYRVRARNAMGDSDPTAAVFVIGPPPPVPLAPTDLRASFIGGASGGFQLTWTDASDNETAFFIEQKIEAEFDYDDWLPLTTVPPDTTEFLDTSFTYAQIRYRVRASNRGGHSAWSEEAVIMYPPAPPVSLTGVPTAEGIALAWEDRSVNETGFSIERAEEPFLSTFVLHHETKDTITSYLDAWIQKGKKYHYRVRATNVGNISEPTNTVAVTALPDPPAAPSALSLGLAETANATVRLQWIDHATNETGFTIERSLTGTAGDWEAIGTAPANSITHLDTGLLSLTRYHYRVRAFNAGGFSSFSNTAFIDTSVALPAPPTDVTATPLSSFRIRVTWTHTSSPVSSFIVERAPAATGPWTTAGITSAPDTTFEDVGRTAQTRYYYRVQATNATGPSPYSMIVSADTPLFLSAPTSLHLTIVSSARIDIRWTDTSDNETGFVIERHNGQDPNAFWTVVATVGANVTAFTDTSLAPSNHYLYRIRAIRGALSSEYSNEAPATTRPCLPDGIKEELEFCDDDNVTPGDGCSPMCVIEEGWTCSQENGEKSICQRCGNGIIEGNETCDDANTIDGDGCGAYACHIESGWTCAGEPSVCHRCGNGTIEAEETCDDGNTNATDGCHQCQITADWTCEGEPSVCQTCGNGIREGSELASGRCDDGDTENGDGCSASCVIEPGWICYGSTVSICKKCGNGIIEGNETCDDKNTIANDGCSSTCQIEPRWTCTGTPSACYRCGDGIIDPGQECDQLSQQTLSGDGCSNTCTLEPGWSCTVGFNSLCGQTCGDGIVNGADVCDDGSIENGDGCSASCRVETGWSCVGSAPSVCQSALASTLRRLMQIGPQDIPTLRQRLVFLSDILRAEQSQDLKYDVNNDVLVNRQDTRLLLKELRTMLQ